MAFLFSSYSNSILGLIDKNGLVTEDKKMNLWDKEEECKFFKEKLQQGVNPDQLFYKTDDSRYVAHWPKSYKGKKGTLQSRNSFIGDYTEEWIKNLLGPIANEFGYYAMRGVICEEIGLSKDSPADVAMVKIPEKKQNPEDIILLVEVKMSIVWNWEYDPGTGEIKCIGDYTTHQGNPGLLRSDTMLKAIGKSIDIRVSGPKASRIPIIVIGNTPITLNYYSKVDNLKKAGIIQGFYSVNPKPLEKDNVAKNIKSTPGGGFVRIDDYNELKSIIGNLIREDREFFSGMITKKKLGEIIEISN